MKESKFQADLVKDIRKRFDGCEVIKIDPTFIQGFPDLLILYNDRWAALECKRDSNAKHQPNQDYRVNKLNDMSYASFIFPQNKEEVLDELEQALRHCR